MARLTILTTDEIDALYTIPVLDDEERAFLFVLDNDDKAYLDTLNNDISCQINYILQLGYFKAKQYFFTFSLQKVKPDADFIRRLYYPEAVFPKKQLLRKSHYRNRTQIITKYQLQETSGDSDLGLLKEAKALAKRHALPRFVLEGLLSFCQQGNIIRPAYSRLQDIVSKALRVERKRLVARLYSDASTDARKRLDALLDNDDLFYSLTLIKKDQKNFRITEIKKTIGKQQLISALYDASCPLMLKLGISEQNILYYANLAEFYTIQNLKQLKDKIEEIPCTIRIVKKDLTKECIDDKFDGIISSMTIHHIQDLQAIFKTFYELLKDNASIALADLDLEDGTFHKEDTGVFHFGFNRNEFKQLAKKAGFRNIKIQTVGNVIKPYGEYSVFLLTANK